MSINSVSKMKFHSNLYDIKRSRRKEAERNNVYAKMFLEDIRNNLIPYTMMREGGGFKIDIIGPNEDIEKAKALLRSLARNGNERNFSKIYSAALRSIISDVVYNEGVACYEILTGEALGLIKIPSSTLIKLPFYYVQKIPMHHRVEVGKKFLVARDNNILKLSIPQSCGGVNGFLRVMQNLNACNDVSVDLLGDVNYKLYKKSQYSFILSATKQWGWNARGIAKNYVTKGYAVYRDIVFRTNMCQLRVFFSREINSLFERLFINAKITVEEKYNVAVLERTLCELKHNVISLEEARIRSGL